MVAWKWQVNSFPIPARGWTWEPVFHSDLYLSNLNQTQPFCFDVIFFLSEGRKVSETSQRSRSENGTEAMFSGDRTTKVTGPPSPAAIENWKKIRRVSLSLRMVQR